MNIFGRLFGQKASAAGGAISGSMVGQPVWTDRNPVKLAEEGYRKNVVAFRSIHLIARGCASVPWTLMSGKDEIDTHPILDLLHRPNPLQGGAALIEALVAFRQLAGNSYLEAATGADDVTPVELWCQRPDRMRVIRGELGMPAGFEYKVGNEAPVRWDADIITGQSDILHWKTFHPLSDWYGMSPLEAAAWSVDQHNSASQWNQALLQNSARPAGVMTFSPKSGPEKLAQDQYARLKAQIDEQYAGASKAGRMMLLDGGLSWQSMSLSPADMDFLNGKNSSASDIAMAFGVPPQLVGVAGSQTFANYETARLVLWEDKILPELDDLCDSLNNWLLPKFSDGERLKLSYDVDGVAALAPKREKKWAAVSTATFLTTNEKREELGYDRIDVPEADEVLIASTQVVLGSDPAPAEPAVDPAADMSKTLREQGMSKATADELGRLAYGGE